MKLSWLAGLLFISLNVQANRAESGCGNQGVWLQVLGSGGPEINDKRASSSYLVWLNGHARVLVDTGSGSSFNFEQSGADFSDVRTILYSHYHVDHSADLPAYIKASFFIDRQNDLPIYGPSSNSFMPDSAQFVHALMASPAGAFKYLDDFLDDSRANGYRIIAHTLDTGKHIKQLGYADSTMRTTAIPVHHGPVPALAWRLQIAGKVIVFSGDMNGDYRTLPVLAKGADMLVAHNAVPEEATGIARNLHMPPSVIGDIAAQAKVKQLVMSHRMLRTLGKEKQSLRYIRKKYKNSVTFADDMDCFRP